MLTIKKYVSIPCGTDLTALYRAEVGDYPKFFKMDTAASWVSSWRSVWRRNRASRPARTAPC